MLSKELELLLVLLEKEYPFKIDYERLISALIFEFENENWMKKIYVRANFLGYKIDMKGATELVKSAGEAGLIKLEETNKEGKKVSGYCLTIDGYNLLNQTRLERLTKFSAFSIVILTFSLITITLIQSYLNSIGKYGLLIDSQIVYFILLLIVIIWWVLQPRKKSDHLINTGRSKSVEKVKKEAEKQ